MIAETFAERSEKECEAGSSGMSLCRLCVWRIHINMHPTVSSKALLVPCKNFNQALVTRIKVFCLIRIYFDFITSLVQTAVLLKVFDIK